MGSEMCIRDSPEFMHQRQCEVAKKPISIAFDAQVSTAEAVTENETVEEAEDEFDESSDEEVMMIRRFPR